MQSGMFMRVVLPFRFAFLIVLLSAPLVFSEQSEYDAKFFDQLSILF